MQQIITNNRGNFAPLLLIAPSAHLTGEKYHTLPLYLSSVYVYMYRVILVFSIVLYAIMYVCSIACFLGMYRQYEIFNEEKKEKNNKKN